MSQTIKTAKENLEKYDIVSFDIFDTLITRKIFEPDDLFGLLQIRIKQELGRDLDFLYVRKTAENRVWKRLGASSNIDEIYAELTQVADISEDEAILIKQMEIEMEYELCIPRTDVLEIYTCSPLYDCFLLRNLWRGGLTGEI